MKKKLIGIILAIMVILTACEAKSLYIHEDLKNNVDSIEFVEIDLETGNYNIVFTIDGEHHDAFLKDLSDLRFKKMFGMDPANRTGIGIKLLYKNANYDIIYNQLILTYNSEGEEIGPMKHQQTSQKEFDTLINKYLVN